MIQATWNGQVIAQSDQTVVVEGNHYFPDTAVNHDYLRPSDTTSFCGWKGDCGYYSLVVDGKENKDAAWIYRDPYPKASNIKGHIAFWKGVAVREVTAA